MCLAIPMKVIMTEGETGTVEAGGVQYRVSFRLLSDVKVGDYVIVHAGFAIQRLDTADAEQSLRLFEEIDAEGSGEPEE